MRALAYSVHGSTSLIVDATGCEVCSDGFRLRSFLLYALFCRRALRFSFLNDSKYCKARLTHIRPARTLKIESFYPYTEYMAWPRGERLEMKARHAERSAAAY